MFELLVFLGLLAIPIGLIWLVISMIQSVCGWIGRQCLCEPAPVRQTPPASSADFSRSLCKLLTEDLRKTGIEADVTTEEVPGTRLLRVLVVSRQWPDIPPAERQELLWRIMRRHFDADIDLRISMIFTLTPEYPSRPDS